MQIRFIPCLIFHIYKSEKSGGWVGMVGGGGNIARGVKQDIAEHAEFHFCLCHFKRTPRKTAHLLG